MSFEGECQVLMSIERVQQSPVNGLPLVLLVIRSTQAQQKTLQIPVQSFSNLKFANLTWGPAADPTPYWIRREGW